MTTKFLDYKIRTFKILLSWRFPRKTAFSDNSPLCPHAQPPSKVQIALTLQSLLFWIHAFFPCIFPSLFWSENPCFFSKTLLFLKKHGFSKMQGFWGLIISFILIISPYHPPLSLSLSLPFLHSMLRPWLHSILRPWPSNPIFFIFFFSFLSQGV